MSDQNAVQGPGPVTAPLSKGWLRQQVLIAIALVAFGLWGLYDAMVKYPARGADAAEYLELSYYQALETAGQSSRASVSDPKAALTELRTKHSQAALSGGPERALMDWLDQLSLISKLDPANTTIPRTDFRVDETGQPVQVSTLRDRADYLKKRWTTSTGPRQASPLSAFDLPSQWIIFGLCEGIAIYMFGMIIAAKAKKYSWDPAQLRLTLPGGASLVPADIEEFDKRKWHRLYITLKVRDSHPQLAGKRITIDLKRYEAVEPWVLEMERVAFPENQIEKVEKDEPPADAAQPAIPPGA